VRQVAGTFDGKGKAKAACAKLVAEINSGAWRRSSIDGATVGFLCENWPFGDSVDPATLRTNQERVRSYIIPYLPQGEDTPLSAITSSHVYKVQDALLKRGLAKRTVLTAADFRHGGAVVGRYRGVGYERRSTSFRGRW
jgi:hypothetical protein